MDTQTDKTSDRREARLELERAILLVNQALEKLSPGSAVAAIVTGTTDAGPLGPISPRPIAELGVRVLRADELVLFTEFSAALGEALASKGRAEQDHYGLKHHGKLLGFADEREQVS